MIPNIPIDWIKRYKEKVFNAIYDWNFMAHFLKVKCYISEPRAGLRAVLLKVCCLTGGRRDHMDSYSAAQNYTLHRHECQTAFLAF